MASATKGDGFRVGSLYARSVFVRNPFVTGGTGVANSAGASTTITKTVTGFADTTAKAVFTVTVPNAVHAAFIELDLLGSLGAGGAIGAGEATYSVKYLVSVARTAGVAVVAGVGAAVGAATATVAGGDAITSVVPTISAITGGVTVSETFTINVAITRSGAGATNHTLVAKAHITNKNASGITVA